MRVGTELCKMVMGISSVGQDRVGKALRDGSIALGVDDTGVRRSLQDGQPGTRMIENVTYLVRTRSTGARRHPATAAATTTTLRLAIGLGESRIEGPL
jgi:hypothetical protein